MQLRRAEREVNASSAGWQFQTPRPRGSKPGALHDNVVLMLSRGVEWKGRAQALTKMVAAGQ